MPCQPAMFSFLAEPRQQPGDAQRHLLWIDRVGCWMLMLKDRVSIGGSGGSSEPADISLLAQLSRKHATLERDGENYVMQAHSPVSIAGRAVYDKIDLHDGYELHLGSSVRLKFRLPTVMSGSARIEFASDHRPKHAVEGVVLMDETCLLGPHDDNHIRCPGWTNNVVLYRKGGHLWCKSRDELFIGGKRASPAGMIPPGAIVQGTDFRFRLETIG
jgi:hypothetical protein